MPRTLSRRLAAGLAEMPKLAEALAGGAITAEHAAVAVGAAAKTSAGQVDDELSKLAETSSVDVFTEQSRRWVNRNQLDDGAELYQQQRRNRLLKHWINEEGMGVLLAELDPTSYQQVAKAINVEYDRLWREDGGREGKPDDVRTPQQRSADALIALLTNPARRGPGSTRTQLIAIADIERLRGDNPSGVAEIVGGEALPQSVLERLMCTAAVTGVVFDGEGQPIWVGRHPSTRHRSSSQSHHRPATGTVEAKAAPQDPNDAKYTTSSHGNKAGQPTSTKCASPAPCATTTSTTAATSSSRPTPATKSSTPTTHQTAPNTTTGPR